MFRVQGIRTTHGTSRLCPFDVFDRHGGAETQGIPGGGRRRTLGGSRGACEFFSWLANRKAETYQSMTVIVSLCARIYDDYCYDDDDHYCIFFFWLQSTKMLVTKIVSKQMCLFAAAAGAAAAPRAARDSPGAEAVIMVPQRLFIYELYLSLCYIYIYISINTHMCLSLSLSIHNYMYIYNL